MEEVPVQRTARPSPYGERLTDERLMDLVGEVLAASPPTREDVVDAGRSAWLWHSVMSMLQGDTQAPDGAPPSPAERDRP